MLPVAAVLEAPTTSLLGVEPPDVTIGAVVIEAVMTVVVGMAAEGTATARRGPVAAGAELETVEAVCASSALVTTSARVVSVVVVVGATETGVTSTVEVVVVVTTVVVVLAATAGAWIGAATCGVPIIWLGEPGGSEVAVSLDEVVVAAPLAVGAADGSAARRLGARPSTPLDA